MTTKAAAAPTVLETNGIYEVQGYITSPYYNHDLSPTRLRDRKWATKDIAALWISMSASVHKQDQLHRARGMREMIDRRLDRDGRKLSERVVGRGNTYGHIVCFRVRYYEPRTR
jgi:hypothetical protein